MARLRKEKLDNRRRVDLNDTQAEWCDLEADRLGISFMAVIRKLIKEKMTSDKELSQKKAAENTANSGTNRTHPNGLYTADQVAELLNAQERRKAPRGKQ